jgi:hypothetical protein
MSRIPASGVRPMASSSVKLIYGVDGFKAPNLDIWAT